VETQAGAEEPALDLDAARKAWLSARENQKRLLDDVAGFVAKGNLREATKRLDELTQAAPELNEAWDQLILLNAQVENLESLHKVRNRLQRCGHDDDYLMLYCRAVVLGLEGRTQEARNAFRKAMELNRRNRFVLEAFLRMEVRERNTDALGLQSMELLQMDSGNAYGHYVSACMDVLSGDIKSAEKALWRSLKKQTSMEALNDLSVLLMAKGKIAEAEQVAQESIKLDDQRLPSWIVLGQILARARKFDEAESAYKRAFALNSRDPSVLLALAELQQARGNRENALSWANRCMELQDKLSSDDAERLAAVRRWMESA
jgi:tetratricopeptide (TPR) repeat protein